MQSGNAIIRELFQVIEKDKITPEERARMKEEYNQEKANKEAEKKGWKQGKDEGWKEGEAATQEKLASNLKANGKLTEEEIANITGLSVERIKTL